LTVPPSPRRIARTSESDALAQPHRRCGPIGPASDDGGATRTSPGTLARPLAVSASARPRRSGADAAALAARHCSYGLAT
jgi:hypothetical protein